MSHRHVPCLLLCGVLIAGSSVAAQSGSPLPPAGARPGYDIDFIGPPLPDPIMQHAKET